jgi:hypothetical protein
MSKMPKIIPVADLRKDAAAALKSIRAATKNRWWLHSASLLTYY